MSSRVVRSGDKGPLVGTVTLFGLKMTLIGQLMLLTWACCIPACHEFVHQPQDLIIT